MTITLKDAVAAQITDALVVALRASGGGAGDKPALGQTREREGGCARLSGCSRSNQEFPLRSNRPCEPRQPACWPPSRRR